MRSQPAIADLLQDELRAATLMVWWANVLVTHQELLANVEDIAKFAVLWNRPQTLWRANTEGYNQIPFSRESPILPLEYIGDPHGRVEGLARIQSTFQVLLGDLQVDISVACSDGKPGGRYEGLGRIGTHNVWIILEVPWRPEGCNIVYVEPDEPWRRNYGHYSVRCKT